MKKIDIKDLGECVKKVVEHHARENGKDNPLYLFDILNINDFLRLIDDLPEGSYIAITERKNNKKNDNSTIDGRK